MIIKTRAGLADPTIAAVKALHKYTNPALLVVPIIGGSADYLSWLGEQTSEPAAQ